MFHDFYLAQMLADRIDHGLIQCVRFETNLKGCWQDWALIYASVSANLQLWEL